MTVYKQCPCQSIHKNNRLILLLDTMLFSNHLLTICVLCRFLSHLPSYSGSSTS